MLIFFPEQQWYLGLHLWEDSNDGAENRDVKTDESETKCQRGLCIYIGALFRKKKQANHLFMF